MPVNSSVTDPPTTADNVTVRTHSVERLRSVAESRGLAWDSLDKRERRLIATVTPPTSVVSTHNVTVAPMHRMVVGFFDPTRSVADTGAQYLAVGDGATVPTVGDEALAAERDRIHVAVSEDNGRDLFTSTFLDATEANGINISEVGLTNTADPTASDAFLFNRALLPQTINKREQNTATVDVTLRVRDESEVQP